MSKIDLSTLPAQELRQLLDSARNHGHAAQSYEILREMDARRTQPAPAPGKPRRRSRRREPRLIELQLGDPLDAPDEPYQGWDDDARLTLGHASPPPIPAALPAPVRSRWGHWGALCFAAGLGGGVAAGWWAAGGGSWAPPQPALVSAAQAAPRPPLPVTVRAEPAVATPPAPPAPVAAETELASAAEPAVTQSPPEPIPDTAEVASAGETACGGEPTPADAVICREPRLRRLQAELRRAYAQALAAHEDRSLLRQRQLAWRDGRNTVSSPDQLARLYLRRIEQLKAATAEAIRER